jgi:Uncharacterised nucleotidyltransferase
MNHAPIASARMLANILRDPLAYAPRDAGTWTGIITIARAEQLLGTLAFRLRTLDLPPPVAAIMEDARTNAHYQRRAALWEADCAHRALETLGQRVVLMKGTAYVAAGLKAGEGRHIGDLDIMVAREHLPETERLLMTHGGWEWVKEDAYDDAYYRNHMHELPPMIHKDRDRMIDVHHTILPITARPCPDAASMLEDAVKSGALFVFSPADMICHSAAHLLADGDLTGGMRNMWDIHCLMTEFSEQDSNFWNVLSARARHHGLLAAVRRAARLSADLYDTPIAAEWNVSNHRDHHYIRRILARDVWGRGTHPFTRAYFYIRSHWLRMPPLMLARHLWTKWRKG